MSKISGDILGLDLGAKRTGVARINTQVKIAEPLDPIDEPDQLVDRVRVLVDEYQAQAVVVGRPRGLDGQSTQQTKWAEKVQTRLENALSVPVHTIDEAGTTKVAKERVHDGQSVDSVAAGIFLEDFVAEQERGHA